MAAGWLSRVQVVENTNVQDYSSAKVRLPLDVEVSDQKSPQEGDCTSSSSVQEGSCQRNEALFLGFPSIPKEDARAYTLWQVKKEGTAWLDSAPSELERMGSGMSTVSGCGGSGADSDMGDEGRRLSTLTEPGKLPSSQFKGVVPQPNGRWGAQIYEKHQRLWLGTFNEEEEAAKAYDRAALKFRGRDAMTNFSPVGDGDPEAVFLNTHTKEQIVDMLRRHTYEDELEQSCRPARGQAPAQEATVLERRLRDSSKEAGAAAVVGGVGGVAGAGSGYSSASSRPRDHLFEKALTPSDVGKLNRLVIPKQHAERCFPLDANSNEKGLLLNFEDPSRKVWRFRYSYWNSSQSYVLTKGWSRFVKEKKLSAGDIVSFERAANDHLFISCRRRPASCTSLQLQNHQRFSEQQGMVPASVRAQLVAASSLQARNLHPTNFLNPWLQTAEKLNHNGANRLSDLEAFVQQCRPHSRTISAAPAVLLPQEVSAIWHSGSIAWTSFGLADRLTSAGSCERGAPGSAYQASINGIRSDSSVGLQGTIGSSHSDARVPTSDRTSTVDFKLFGAHVANKHSTESDIAGVQEFSESSTSREEIGSLLELKREQCGQRPTASQRRLVTSNATHEASVGTKQSLRLFGVDLVPSTYSPVSLNMKMESEQALIGDNLTLDLPCYGRWVDQKANSDACVYTSKMCTVGDKRKSDVLDAESSAESCPRKFKLPSI